MSHRFHRVHRCATSQMTSCRGEVACRRQEYGRLTYLGPKAHRCALGGVNDTWISGKDVNTFCCYGLAYPLDSW
jgi:hypothetical protein